MRKIFTLVAAILMTACLCAQSWSAICTYSGYVQPLTVPTSGIYKLHVWGAQGGTFGSSNAGALGGYATCYAQLNANETIYIYVGGKGGDGVDAAGGAGGWNGGGHGGYGVNNYHGSAGGGGATHISKVNNQVIGSGSGQCASLVGTNYIIVAGGGGGAGHPYSTPGAGGGTTGGLGTRHDGSAVDYAVRVNYTNQYYYSASRSYGANGGNGYADSWACEGAGGGGGGYYGGNANVANGTFAASCQDAGGCGGNSNYNSNYAFGFSTSSGQRSGNGQAQLDLVLQGSGTASDPYLIPSTTAWNTLANLVAAGNTFSGKYFRQTGDFTITNMVGTGNHLDGGGVSSEEFITFNGIYDGDGHTLNVNIDVVGERYVGPFHCVSGATIRNLIVTGYVSITGGSKTEARRHPSALIGCCTTGNVLIENCHVSANISGADYIGGLIGHSWDANVTIRGCVYSGTLTAEGNNYTGGFIGWGGDHGGVTIVLTNNLFVGSYSGSGKFHPMGFLCSVDNNTRTITNSY